MSESTWKPAVIRPDGRREELDLTESVWITHFLPLCDNPQQRGREGSIPGLYPQGLLSLYLCEEGFSFREIAALLNRDLAHVKRMETNTRNILRESIERRDSLASDVEDTRPMSGDDFESVHLIAKQLREFNKRARLAAASITPEKANELSVGVMLLWLALNDLSRILTGLPLSLFEFPEEPDIAA